MAVIHPLMLKVEEDDEDLKLTAAPERSLLVKDIWIYNPLTTTAYITVKTALTTVGYFRVYGKLGNHLALPPGSVVEDYSSDPLPKEGYETLLGYLRRLGHFTGYPVAEGEEFLISGAHQAGCIQAVLYEECDAGDHVRTDPNGSEASERLLVEYGRPDAAVATATSTLYNTRQSPQEFPNFPWGVTVPGGMDIDVLGVLASDLADWRLVDDYMYTHFLQFWRGETFLFDEDKNGILLEGVEATTTTEALAAEGVSLIGNFSDKDQKKPLMFVPPLSFVPGESLDVYIKTASSTTVTSATLTAADLEIALIERIRRRG